MIIIIMVIIASVIIIIRQAEGETVCEISNKKKDQGTMPFLYFASFHYFTCVVESYFSKEVKLLKIVGRCKQTSARLILSTP